MKIVRSLIAIAISAAVIFSTAAPVLAVSGVPGSPDFGIGVSLSSQDTTKTLQKAATSGISWVKVEISWKNLFPSPDQAPDFSVIDSTAQIQKQSNSALLISLKDPPTWSVDCSGPSLDKALAVIDAILIAFPQVTAIELLPEANTVQGWGASPDAVGYTKLLQATQYHLNRVHSSVLLVAGGLKAVNTSSPGQINDLDFLQQMYNSGAAASMPVLSIHLDEISASSADKPGTNSANFLRHYEEIRRVMLANHHSSGLIWITSLHYQSAQPAIEVSTSYTETADWMSQAVRQMRSQLYLGLVILPDITTVNSLKDL